MASPPPWILSPGFALHHPAIEIKRQASDACLKNSYGGNNVNEKEMASTYLK
jgi:hypothetical protein